MNILISLSVITLNLKIIVQTLLPTELSWVQSDD